MTTTPPSRSELEREVREVMTQELVYVTDRATLTAAIEAKAANRVHAALVVGAERGTPLGWITARGTARPDRLRPRDARAGRHHGAAGRDRSIRELRSALYALSMPGVSRLLVRRAPDAPIEGVVTAFDFMVKGRLLRGL